MKKDEIKIIFLLSYDYDLIKNSLPCVYEYADRILISIDVNRVSWAGNRYEFDENIINWIKDYDADNKIVFFEENFYIPSNTAMQNETRQRQLSADFLGWAGWTIQLDVDEYFVNFNLFVSYLKNLPKKYIENPSENTITIAANWIILLKKDVDGWFIVSNSKFPFRLATNYPKYSVARKQDFRTRYTRFMVLHQSLAREEKEIEDKMRNSGHNNAFIEPQQFLEFWKNLNKSNYKFAKNFSPVPPKSTFSRISFISAKSIQDLISFYTVNIHKESALFVLRKNLIQYLVSIILLRKIYFSIQDRIYRYYYKH